MYGIQTVPLPVKNSQFSYQIPKELLTYLYDITSIDDASDYEVGNSMGSMVAIYIHTNMAEVEPECYMVVNTEK